MTDPIDHSARIREIEARAAEAERTGYTRSFDRAVPADLRYLLDRVRAQSERIEALEGIARRTWSVRTRDGSYYCAGCGAAANHTSENIHLSDCIVLTFPAPETVEINEPSNKQSTT